MMLSEAIVDRSPDLDQSAKHVHVRGRNCPSCSFDGTNADAAEITRDHPDGGNADARSEYFERPVSPAILQHKIRMLEKDLLHEQQMRASAERRIRQFERFTTMLAEYLDNLRSDSTTVQVNSKAA